MSKRFLVISGAIVLVGLLIAVWVYVMFFGTPRELPENLTFPWNNTPQTPPAANDATTTPTSDSTAIPNFSAIPLKQLTTRPVVGYREIATSSTASSGPGILYYAEAGTGHVYQIDLTTGIETRRSGTTIIDASEAVFSPDGRFVVFRSGDGRSAKTILGTFSSEGLTTTDLGINIDQFTITSENVLLYSQKEAVMRAFSRALPSGTPQTLFSLPFREATILWGSSPSDSHVVFPRPSYLLPGALYEVKGGKLTRLPFEGFGLSAFRSGSLVGVGFLNGPENYAAQLYDLNTSDTTVSATFFPEKCTGSAVSKRSFWCTNFSAAQPLGFPDTWYRGELSFADTIQIRTLSGVITERINLQNESGRTIDLFRSQSVLSEDGVYFINRLDNTLWRYLAL